MDPASASELRDFLSHSNSRIDRQEEQMAASNHAVQSPGLSGLGADHPTTESPD